MALKDKIQSALDKTDVDDKIVAGVKNAGAKVKNVLDKTDVDDKIVAGVKKGAGKVEEVVGNALDKTDIDEKIAAKAGELKDKLTGKKEEK